MLIILEGPDGAGKSYLRNKLAHRLVQLGESPPLQLHAGPPTTHPLDEYESPLMGYRPSPHSPLGQLHVICDRWHLGEIVYPRVFRRPTRYDPAVNAHVELFLRARGAIVVFVYDDINVMKSRVGPGRDDFVRAGHIPALMQEYRSAIAGTRLPLLQWKSVRVDIDSIISAAQRAEESVQHLAPFTTYIGEPKPDFLLLGENRGVSARTNYPAFMPYAATSGHFLLSHLDTGSYDIGISNACDVDNADELWHQLGCPCTVTLGAAAHRAFLHEHGAMPHPQFVRRFHYRNGDRYGKLIEKTMYDQEDRSSWRPSFTLRQDTKTIGS
jgi:hypothetical protein